ncbi:hypothetical protein [Rhodococcus tibetensis]|uniref:DUF317 domain-containing protein n=1 Tax=Rhodococcus tibetensis TaxID=2965064 RepID=A0ABT1Q832_9NOCA|nr:hypothetical protein [Rhodococcus sp. FXJ9.536]MCQ4118419.1 hypothetical protein [Rhodococcus sp. FXJ9.536]
MPWDPETTDSQNWDERGLRLAAQTTAGAWIFHPANTIDDEPVLWADVAEANATIAHPVMEWGSIVGSWRTCEQEGLWHDSPATGSLPAPEARALADILRQFTRTPDSCWFAHWEGSGYITAPSTYPRLPMPGRGMVLFAGSLDLADTQFGAGTQFPGGMSAHLWWPEDRAWCVATDIDLMTTYLGASAECVDAVLAEAALEVLPATPDQRVTWDSDTINPLPPSPSG